MSTEYNLSYDDLVLVDGFKEAWLSQNKKIIDQILFNNGMDIGKDVEIVPREHRTLSNKRVNSLRFEGWERLDKEWISTGAASLAAVIESTEDKSLRRELRVMSAQRNQDKAFD